jgi:hypothetical protein
MDETQKLQDMLVVPCTLIMLVERSSIILRLTCLRLKPFEGSNLLKKLLQILVSVLEGIIPTMEFLLLLSLRLTVPVRTRRLGLVAHTRIIKMALPNEPLVPFVAVHVQTSFILCSVGLIAVTLISGLLPSTMQSGSIIAYQMICLVVSRQMKFGAPLALIIQSCLVRMSLVACGVCSRPCSC